MGSPQGILFGQKAPTVGFEPENVIGDSAPIVSRRNRRSQIAQTAPTTAVDLHQRYVNSTHVPSPADARLELDRARTLNALIAKRQQERLHTQKLLSGAALAESLGALDVRDPEYAVKSSKIFSQYSDGADTQAAKDVAAMKHSEFTAFTTANDKHREAVYHATLTKRVAPLLGSDQVPSALKDTLINDDGSFNAAAIAQAEKLHSSGGSGAGKEFYADLGKKHGYTRNDLDAVVANPSLVKYMGPDGPVTAEAVKGKEKDFRAVADLPNGGTLNLPLPEFNSLASTHKNLNRAGTQSADDLAAQEQVFRDRAVMETTLATQGLVPASATPSGYDSWKAAQPRPYTPTPPGEGNAALPATDYAAPSPAATPAPAVSDPISFLKRALGTAPAATPAPSPVAAASGLPDDEENRLNGT